MRTAEHQDESAHLHLQRLRRLEPPRYSAVCERHLQAERQLFRPPTFDYAYPAPPHPYPATLGSMAGAEPNGPWKLFVFDETLGEAGSIEGGWSIELTTTGAPAAKKKCKKKRCKKNR
jgi:hypothetical protein